MVVFHQAEEKESLESFYIKQNPSLSILITHRDTMCENLFKEKNK